MVEKKPFFSASGFWKFCRGSAVISEYIFLFALMVTSLLSQYLKCFMDCWLLLHISLWNETH